MKKLFIVFVILFSVLQAEEHEVIKIIDGFEVAKETLQNYSFLAFKGKKNKKYGKIYSYKAIKNNENKKIDKSFTFFEIIQNYKAIAEKNGAEILYYRDKSHDFEFVIKDIQGKNTFVKVYAYNGSYDLSILEEIPLEVSLKFGNLDDYEIKEEKRDEKTSEELEKESHPVIKLLAGFEIINKEIKEFEQEELFVREKKRSKKREVQGKTYFYKLERELGKGKVDKGFSTEEIKGNYKAAVANINGEVVYEQKHYLNFKLVAQSGAVLWGKLFAGDGWYTLKIIEEKGFTQTLVFGADEMEKELEENGKISLYGILFDTGKSTLKERSFPQLEQVTKLLMKNKELKLEVQGHTDNVGDDTSNMKLSEERSKQVIDFLELFGVNKDNLKAKGYGESKPIADNATEEGRAKNRRVDLVKIN